MGFVCPLSMHCITEILIFGGAYVKSDGVDGALPVREFNSVEKLIRNEDVIPIPLMLIVKVREFWGQRNWKGYEILENGVHPELLRWQFTHKRLSHNIAFVLAARVGDLALCRYIANEEYGLKKSLYRAYYVH